MGKITLKNISSGMVVVLAPDIGFRRELIPGRAVPITEQEYDALIFDPGVDALIQGHTIKIEGVEEDQQVTVDNTTIYEAADIAKMLKDKDITAFAKFIPNATDSEKDSVVKYAIDNKIVDNPFVALIKKYCDVDVINAINIQHQLNS